MFFVSTVCLQSTDIVSDRGPQFVSMDRTKASWSDHLMWVEYAHNSLPTAATRLSPFQVFHGYQPPLFPTNEEEVTVPSAHAMARRCRKIWAAARRMLLRGQERMKATADRHCRPAPVYAPDQKEWLSTKDLPLHVHSRKLASQPLYTPLVQKQPVTTRSVRRWSPEKESALRDCFNTTVWDVLMNPHGEDIEGMTHCLTDYLNFCADVVSPVKTVRCYPNNKPWVTREVKTVLNKKKAAFRSRDREAMKAAQQEVKHCVKEAKDSYRRKVEQKLRENNMREVWEGVRTITGLNTKTKAVGGTMERANELNDFFNRFNQPLAPPPPPSPQPSPLSPPYTSPQTPQQHRWVHQG
ncbi:hypothetical protein L3Q82_015317 [Scortum barcoo]|uniref:Uncharacterized protein n=1 Tax=Scortum barcoo TaxID=214431 RepID=A0ACB8VTX6_9TELE|nr:hypothetical protein L3Q82_015317 [Scortum barcoo]